MAKEGTFTVMCSIVFTACPLCHISNTFRSFGMSRNAPLKGDRCVISRKTAAKATMSAKIYLTSGHSSVVFSAQ